MTIIHADVLKWLRGNQWQVQHGYLPKAHAVFADPPYFLGSIAKRFGGTNAKPPKDNGNGEFHYQRLARGFMGTTWDGFSDVWEYQAWVTEWASLLIDFVHPGALLAMFGGTRTYHRLAAGLEDAGWEVFDEIIYLFGSGFPKAHTPDLDMPSHKTALKPAHENIVLARAPRGNATYAELAQRWGTGAINVDAGRIGEGFDKTPAPVTRGNSKSWFTTSTPTNLGGNDAIGRYPANLILDDVAAAALDAMSGESGLGRQDWVRSGRQFSGWQSVGDLETRAKPANFDPNESGASRFFYTAKAPAWEREAGLTDFEQQTVTDGRETPIDNAYQRGETKRRNIHPTVKPIQLTEYIARLLLPPVLDVPRRILVPFAGVGSEQIGATLAGWDEVVGIEMTAEYIPINEARRRWWGQFRTYEQAQTAYRPAVQVVDDFADLPLFASAPR